MYPLTDSSYDSLENDLDNSSGGSPGFCTRGRLKPKQLQGSLDSILTFSDWDQDTEPDPRQRPPQSEGTRVTTQEPELPKAPPVSAASNLEWLSLDPRHGQRRRRCSEPAIAYMARQQLSSDTLTGEDEEEDGVFLKKPMSEAAAPAGGAESSQSSGHTWVTRREETTTQPLANLAPTPAPAPFSVPFTTFTPSPERGACPKTSPSWGTLKDRGSLHPNSWLKKSRMLSRSQQDNLEKDEDVSVVSKIWM